MSYFLPRLSEYMIFLTSNYLAVFLEDIIEVSIMSQLHWANLIASR